jgi:hypothetical protein
MTKFHWGCNECGAHAESLGSDIMRDMLWIHWRNTKHLNCKYWIEK